MEAVPVEYSHAPIPAAAEERRTWIQHLPWIGIALVLALVARLPYYWSTPYALNDGGMFAQIVDDLRANHFALPRETTYNFAHIPLCYPPLGFYFGAIWTAVFHQSAMDALRWVPLLFNLLCIPALYLLALEYFESAWLAGCAASLYAVIPRSSEWLTMGGGLTRSPGELFALIAMLLFLRSLKGGSWRLAIWSGVAVGLAFLTHLEAGLLGAVSLAVLGLLFTSVRKGLPLLVVAGVVSAAVSAPWFIWAIARYGSGPFAAAFLTHGADGSAAALLTPSELMAWVLLILTMAIFRLPPWGAWILALYIFIPRSAETHIAIVYALFLTWLLSRVAVWLSTTNALPQVVRPWQNSMRNGLWIACLLLCLVYSLRFVHRHHNSGTRLSDLYLDDRAAMTTGDVAAMEWVRSHLPASAKFFVFDQRSRFWARDMVAEWFPYLAQRESVYTAQGREWLPHHAFSNTVKMMIPNTQGCTDHAVHKLLQNASFDYMFVSGPLDEDFRACVKAVQAESGITREVYAADNVRIFTLPSSSQP